MAKYVFSNTSGYNDALTKLKTQVTSIQDDNNVQVIGNNSVFNYANNIASDNVLSHANFPLFIISSSNERRDRRTIQNSIIEFNCYLVFDNVKSGFETTFNQFISKLIETFDNTYPNEFIIENINRSSGAPPELGRHEKFSKLWTCNLTITRNNVKY